jgi:hypothetical protein
MEEKIVVKAGKKVIDYFPADTRYRYSQFFNGLIVFRDDTRMKVRLNYNILYGEIQYIDKKDTLFIGNPKTIYLIKILEDTFYFDKNYLRLVTGRDPVQMLVNDKITLLDAEKNGAYGTSSATSAINSVNTLYDNNSNRYFNLVTAEDLVLLRKKEYFIGNVFQGFYLYRKNSLHKLFPKQAIQIDSYIKMNNVDFKNEDDLKKLTQYIQGL